MKSSIQQLEERGYLEKDYQINKYNLSELVDLLKSNVATERTLAARLLNSYKNDESTTPLLIAALTKEKSLYTKIEICDTLIAIGINSVLPLIALLGTIGGNQHKSVPDRGFGKDNYPLPRDIAARTLARIGADALPYLVKELSECSDLSLLSELVDAIGFICFYSKTTSVFNQLQECYFKNSNCDLIKWKIIRSFSAFSESREFLCAERVRNLTPRITLEIDRSLRIIAKRAASL